MREYLPGTGVPPRMDMGPVEVIWDGVIMGYIWGTPMDKQTSVKQYLPHSSDAGGNNYVLTGNARATNGSRYAEKMKYFKRILESS